MLTKNQRIRTTIESVSSDGSGVSRHDGMVIFTPYTAPGDFVDIVIVKTAKTHAYGKIIEILKPSECRIEPGCAYFMRCGGCAFRHIEYEEELEIKHRIVADSLSRIGKIKTVIRDIIPAPSTDSYRNKAQLPVFGGEEGLDFGFYAPRSHRVIPIGSGCLLHSQIMAEIAETCCRLLGETGVTAYDETNHSGQLRHIIIRESGDGSVMLALVMNADRFPGELEFCGLMTEKFSCIKTILINNNTDMTNVILGKNTRVIRGGGFIYDRLAEVPIRLSLASFFQVNRQAAERLYGVIKKYAAPSNSKTLLDLYCGVGSIGLSMAGDLNKLVGADVVREAVGDAEWSAGNMGINNAEFICADAAAAAERFTEKGEKADIVITDPPRKGCDRRTLQAIEKIAPECLIMVSCNPASLARDLAFLSERGFRAAEITPVDMFPRTPHVECVALLKKI